jgi:hypothetical protein
VKSGIQPPVLAGRRDERAAGGPARVLLLRGVAGEPRGPRQVPGPPPRNAANPGGALQVECVCVCGTIQTLENSVDPELESAAWFQPLQPE